MSKFRIKNKRVMASLLTIILIVSASLIVLAFSHHSRCNNHYNQPLLQTETRAYTCKWCSNHTEIRRRTGTTEVCRDGSITLHTTIVAGPWSSWIHTCNLSIGLELE